VEEGRGGRYSEMATGKTLNFAPRVQTPGMVMLRHQEGGGVEKGGEQGGTVALVGTKRERAKDQEDQLSGEGERPELPLMAACKKTGRGKREAGRDAGQNLAHINPSLSQGLEIGLRSS